MEIWTNIPGTNVYQLKQDRRFPDKPSATSVVRNMAAPVNKGDNYGLRLTAYYKVKAIVDIKYSSIYVCECIKDRAYGQYFAIPNLPNR